MDQNAKNTVKAVNQVADNMLIENAEGSGLRVLFVGNSITRHGILPEIGWLRDCGMAASEQGNDYVNTEAAELWKKDPDAVIGICQAADWELAYRNGESVYPQYISARAFGADVIVMRVIENCHWKEFDHSAFQREYLKFIQYLNPGKMAKVILTSGFWKHPGDDRIREVAEENGWAFVYLGDLGDRADMRADGLYEHSGVAHHPGDSGMQVIAERILEKI